MKTTQEALISIGRMRGNEECERPIRIEIRQTVNAKVVFVAYVSLETFADITVGNLGMAPCTLESY